MVIILCGSLYSENKFLCCGLSCICCDNCVMHDLQCSDRIHTAVIIDLCVTVSCTF